MPHPITSISKTIHMPPIGVSLTGYDSKGRIMVIIPCRKVESITKWMARGITKSEKARVQEAFDTLDEETKQELINR